MSGVLTAAMLLTMAPATAFAADDAPAAENQDMISTLPMLDGTPVQGVDLTPTEEPTPVETWAEPENEETAEEPDEEPAVSTHSGDNGIAVQSAIGANDTEWKDGDTISATNNNMFTVQGGTEGKHITVSGKVRVNCELALSGNITIEGVGDNATLEFAVPQVESTVSNALNANSKSTVTVKNITLQYGTVTSGTQYQKNSAVTTGRNAVVTLDNVTFKDWPQGGGRYLVNASSGRVIFKNQMTITNCSTDFDLYVSTNGDLPFGLDNFSCNKDILKLSYSTPGKPNDGADAVLFAEGAKPGDKDKFEFYHAGTEKYNTYYARGNLYTGKTAPVFDDIAVDLGSAPANTTASGQMSQTLSKTGGEISAVTIAPKSPYTAFAGAGDNSTLTTLNSNLPNGLTASWDNNGNIKISGTVSSDITTDLSKLSGWPNAIQGYTVDLSKLPDGLTKAAGSGDLKQSNVSGNINEIKLTVDGDHIAPTQAELDKALNGTGLTATVSGDSITISGTPTQAVSGLGNLALTTAQAKDSNGGKYASVSDALGKVSTGTITATGDKLTPVESGTLKKDVTLKTKQGEFTAKGNDASVSMDKDGNITVKSGKAEAVGAVKATIGGKDMSFAGDKSYTVDTANKTLTVPAGATVTDGDGVKYTGEGTFTFGENGKVTVPAGAKLTDKNGAAITGVDSTPATEVTLANGEAKLTGGKGSSTGKMNATISDLGDKSFDAKDGKKYTVDTANKTLTTDEAGTVEVGNTKFTGAAGDKFQLGKTTDGKTTAEIPAGATVEGGKAKIKGVEPAEGKNATKVELDPTTGEPTLVAGKGEVTGEATVKVAVKDKDGNITKTVEVAIPSGKTYTIDADNLPPQVGKLAEGESITLGGIKYTAGAADTEFPIGEDKLTNTGDKATVPAGKGAEIALGDGTDAPTITVPDSNTGATTITKGGTKGDATTPTTVRVPANGKFTLNGKDYIAGNEGATFVVDEANKTASLETGNAAVKAGDSLGVKTGDKVIPVTAADKDIVVKAGDPEAGKSSATVPNGGKVTIGSGDNAKTYPSKEDGTKFTFGEDGDVTLASGTTELGKDENVIGGGSGKNIANAGEGAITVKANDPSGKDTVTVPADGKIKIGDTEYDAGANGATIVAGNESNKLTNGSLKLDNTEGVTVGKKDVPVKNTGDKQIEVKADGTVTVPADGELEVGSGDKTAKITDVTKDTIFKIGEDGKTNVTLPEGGSVTINGVTYTDDGTGTGKLTIDENGKVSGAENIKAEISEDSLKDPNFEYDLIPGVSVTAGKYTYTAPKDGALGDVTLKARTETTGEGQVTKALNPEITIKKDKGTVEVALKDNKDTKTNYTVANANTKFAMSANDTDTTKVDLLDNKATEAGKNSALKFTDKAGEAKQSHTVNGVTYQGQEVKDKDGKAQDTSYTVSFGEAEVDTGKKDEQGNPIKEKVNRNTVSVDSGSKVSASMNANGTINIGSGKVGEDKFTTDKSFTASNNGASILIDNTDSSNPNQIAGNGNSYVTPIYGKNADGTDNTKDIKGYQVTRRSSSGGGGGSSSSSGSSIKTGTVKNGTITVSPKSASKDQKVTVTVKPDAGYKLGSLTVTDKNGNKVSLTKKNDNEYTFVMPAGGVTVNGTFVKAGEAADYASCPKDENCVIAKFKDAKPNAWYHDGVHYCLDNGLMVGVTADTFNPNGNITRGQIVTMLWRQAGSPIVIGEKFNDVAASEYYAQAVEWAAANKIVTGYGNGNFGPKKAITREQLAAILYRFAQFKGMDTSVGGMSLNEFADNGSVSDYAHTAMQWAISNKIVTGINSTTIDPKGTATRAQAANLMQRFLTELK